MKRFIKTISALTIGIFLFNSCADLDIENPNDRGLDDLLVTVGDVANIPGGAFLNWWYGTSTVNTGPAMAANADMLTCSWGNFGFRNFSWQPPIPINNSLTSNDAAAIGNIYTFMYRANNLARDVEVYVRDNEGEILLNGSDVRPMLNSVSLFLEGAAHGYVSISYNQGFLFDAETDLSALNGEGYVDYQTIRDFAVNKLETAAEIAEANTFTLPSTYINGTALTSVEFAELARTMAAQILVYNARNPTEYAAVDWQRVLDNTEKGLSYDFGAVGDASVWFDDVKGIGGGALANGNIATTWARVDMKVMNLIDPSYPSEYPASGIAGEVTTDDARIDTDFLYEEDIPFPEDRGRYRFSEYIHNRYGVDAYGFSGDFMPKVLKAENDLMMAEAIINTSGPNATAAELINNTRVGRGGLPALTGAETEADMIAALRYEYVVELLNTWGGRELAEARRWGDWLRDGAFEQLPVPGDELTLLGVPIYTFGGVE